MYVQSTPCKHFASTLLNSSDPGGVGIILNPFPFQEGIQQVSPIPSSFPRGDTKSVAPIFSPSRREWHCVCSQKAFPHPLQAHQLETASLPTASAPTCCVHPQQAHPLECAHLMEPALCDLCAPSKPATQGIQRQCALQAQWGLSFPKCSHSMDSTNPLEYEIHTNKWICTPNGI